MNSYISNIYYQFSFTLFSLFQRLNISNNNLDRLAPNAFADLSSLESIELNHNKISKLSADLFNASRQLQHINLSNNLLNNINATLFTSLAFLKVLDLSHNQLSHDEFIEALAHADLAQYQDLQLDLSDNHFRVVNITAVMWFGEVKLAGNWWSCKWLVREMLRMPKSVHFGKTYTVNTEWSLSLLEASGVDCYDEDNKRSIIILDTAKLWEQRMEFTDCGVSVEVDKNYFGIFNSELYSTNSPVWTFNHRHHLWYGLKLDLIALTRVLW